MMESVLRSKTIPDELRPFIHEKKDGNPFYLEEVVNSLIESETLVPDHASWKLARMLSGADISPTIQGVIAARLDRLGVETKKNLHEASVIGRNFLYIIYGNGRFDRSGNLCRKSSGALPIRGL